MQEYKKIKSSPINALLPLFLKHVFWNGLFFLFLLVLYVLVEVVFSLGLLTRVMFYGILGTVLLSLLKMSKDIIRVWCTEFRFYSTYVESRYKFFVERVHSVHYANITDIKIERSLWDRVCGVGDIVFHTANDSYERSARKALVVRDVRNPERVRASLLRHMQRE